MNGMIEALHIYDDQNRALLSQIYTSRPPSASEILPHYTAYAEPRPSVIYIQQISPPTLVFSLVHSNLLFLITSSTEIEPLLVLEFLHRIVDVLEEFVGSPLLAPKIESHYDVIAQLLNEMCDAGTISTTEPNALRDLVEVEGWIGKLLGNISIPVKPGLPGNSNTSLTSMSSSRLTPLNIPALPWRRANVRHTSNELYVDIIETLSVIIAPSGRPLSAFANGTIVFTSKISGVPDLLLNLSTPSGKQNINNLMELPVFHPCVRLARWRENPGELSFIPPDGKFVLAGYGVDLLPINGGKVGNLNASSLNLPVNFEIKTGLGSAGSEFEVKVFTRSFLNQKNTTPGSALRSGFGSSRLQAGLGPNLGTSTTSLLENVVITIPLPKDLRNLSEIRASRGHTVYSPGGQTLEWQIPAKETTAAGATLRCTVTGPLSELTSDFESQNFKPEGCYNSPEESYQGSSTEASQAKTTEDPRTIAQNKLLMPSSAMLSFSLRGWLASGLKVDSLVIDSKNSRGLGEGVKPFKGVKYLTVSRNGVEMRC
ncbi:hypothetical protein K3495_g2119 [Podosphaera aphanis]|nr:hypothetical protein K3495_g2119 [Podosphaera aphanis]